MFNPNSRLTDPKQLFENKVDHTTYFGANLEFIQGYVYYTTILLLFHSELLLTNPIVSTCYR